METKFNYLKSKWIVIDEEIKQSFCPTCHCVGWVYESGLRKICPTCEGEGKLDWVKKILKGVRDIDYTID